MGTIELFLCILVGQFITVQSVDPLKEQDVTFPQDFHGFFGDIVPFPFKRNFDFTPFDTIFSSWRNRAPDFHMLSEFPPIMSFPRVEVSCDESKLTVLVDKRSYGLLLTGEEIQLGDGCYSNRERPNQFVFTYSLDECGTKRATQNGMETFTNSLHLNLHKPSPTWWQTPSTVNIYCIPQRSYANPNFVSRTPPGSDKIFNIKAMNPSWTSSADSNIYKRGQVVNLQVTAKIKPEQQLFIQSCFVSASPEPQTRPRHAVIMNKGCTAPLGSPHAVAQFVASNRADVVNFVLNTTYLISELYIHCSVLLSDQGVTFSSKSCNYNVIRSRWEDLSGTAEVCECCSSKCRGLSVKHLSEDAKSVVSTGPLVIVDKVEEMSPELHVSELREASSTHFTDSMQSDGFGGDKTADMIVSGTSVSRSRFSSPPQGVVVVSQDPSTRLTLWLPGQVQDAEHNENIDSESEGNLTVQLEASVANDLPEMHLSTTDQESLLNTPANKIRDQNLNFLTLTDWIIPPQLHKAVIVEDPQRKSSLERLGLFGTETQEVNIPLLDEMVVNVLNQNDFNQMGDELALRQADAAMMPQEETNNIPPVIRSKLQFSKGVDGSQILSYEEEVVKQQESDGVVQRCGMDRVKQGQEPRQKGLRLAFLDLFRRMDKAE